MFFTSTEIQQFRNETPGCGHRIHLNNAGASLMPHSVAEAIQQHIELEKNIGGYEASDLRQKEIAAFYQSAAKLFHTRPENIAFTANATDSFTRAISSIPFQQGDVIVTSNEDFISNQIMYLSLAKRLGIKIVRAKSLASGGIDLDDLEKCIKQYHPKLVAVTYIPTNSGLIQPAKEIGALCGQHDTIYLLDACQAVGQMELDVNELKCDFLSVTSRKFLRGPRGSGFLFVSDKILNKGLEPLFIDMRGADWVAGDKYVQRSTAIRFEDWEFAYALVLGTGAAIDYLLKLDIHKIEDQIKFLSDYLRKELRKIDGVTVQDKGFNQAGLVTFHMEGFDPDYVKSQLLERKINVVTSIRNFAVIDFDEKGVDWVIRVSPHYFNTVQELDACIETVKELSAEAVEG